MDAAIQKETPLATGTYEKLGRKTFWLFVFERSRVAAAFLGIAILLFILQGMPSFASTPFGALNGSMALAAWGALALCAVFFLFAFFISWLIYINYLFMIDEDALRIRRGVIAREDHAIPYRQIQDVDIEQDLTYRMLGVSRLVILTAGREDVKEAGDEAEGILPAIDAAFAARLQVELLRRANVETVREEK